MRAGSNWRHLNGLSLGMMGDPVRCLPKVVHPDVAALKLQHNPQNFLTPGRLILEVVVEPSGALVTRPADVPVLMRELASCSTRRLLLV